MQPVTLFVALTTGLATASCAHNDDATTVRVGLPIDPSSLNPLFATTAYEQYFECSIFSGLTATDSQGNIVPDLAQSVPTRTNGGVSPDGLTIVYRLRRGLRWQDGMPLTAADVAFTFSAIRDPKSEVISASEYGDVSGIVARDALTVVAHLKRRWPEAVATIFNNPGGAVLPKHLLRGVSDLRNAAFNANPVGSGPYALQSWSRGSELRLRANRFYFRGRPRIENLRFEFVPSASTRALEALGNNLDFVTDLDPGAVGTFSQTVGLQIVDIPEAVLYFVATRIDAVPLQDPRVRRALSISVDRRAIARKAYFGYATPAMELVPPWSPYATLRSTPPPNIRVATSLLEAAGWELGPDGIRSRLGRRMELALTLPSGSPALLRVALLLQSEWRRLGIDTSLRTVAVERMFATDGPLDRGDFQLALLNWGPFPPDPDRSVLISSRMFPPLGSNYARYRNSIVDAAAARAARSLDLAVRMKAYPVIAESIVQEAPYIPLGWRHELFAILDRVRGIYPDWAGSEFCRADRWYER